MAELGDHARASHEDVATYARARGVERLFALGEGARDAVRAFGAGAAWYGSAGELTAALRPELSAGACVLVKGSRVNRLERVVEALAAGDAIAGSGGDALMLLRVLDWLAQYYGAFRVFNYLTLRASRR